MSAETVRIPSRLYSALYGLFVETREVTDSGVPPSQEQVESMRAAVKRVRSALEADTAQVAERVEQVRCLPR